MSQNSSEGDSGSPKVWTGRAPRTSFRFGVASTFPGAAAPAAGVGSPTSPPTPAPPSHPVKREAPTAAGPSPPSLNTAPPPGDLAHSVELAAVLSALDPTQRAAVCFDASAPLLIQAGAGSGKTQTMAARIAFLLLSGVPPQHILGICFTRQAAETLRQRVRAVLPLSLQSGARLLTLKTLHAFGLQCLRRFALVPAQVEVFDAGKQRRLARRVVEQHAVLHKSAEAVEALVEYVNKAKMKKDLPAAQCSPSVQEGYLFPFYEAALHEEERAVDFGDLQRLLLDALRPAKEASDSPLHWGAEGADGPAAASTPPRTRTSPTCQVLRREYTHLVVDEFQDLNEVQFEILAHLAGDACRVTCVGDPNQCIYGWRGAMPHVFQAWKSRFPAAELRVLEVNYRSDAPIVAGLNKLVSTHQQPHHHRENRKMTLLTCQTSEELEEAVPFIIDKVFKVRDQGLSYSDMAVLCRSRRRVQLYCDALRRKNIPVKELKAVAPDGISIVRALLAYLKLAIAPDMDAEVRIALSGGPRFLPPKHAKSLFLGLESLAEQRRAEAARAGRHHHPHPHPHHPGAADGCDRSAGGLPQAPAALSPYAFYTLLSEAAFHDFSSELYPKLTGPTKAHFKLIKHFIAVVREAHDRLYRLPSCDVAELIRYVAHEGGFESENPVTVNGAAPGVLAATARRRKRHRGEVGAATDAPLPHLFPGGPSGGGGSGGSSSSSALAAAVAAELSTARGVREVSGGGVLAEGEVTTTTPSTSDAPARATRPPTRRPPLAGEGEEGTYTAEEEAALLAAAGRRVSVTELLLCAYDEVVGDVWVEAAGSSTSPTPAEILRRVLDQFITLLPTDDFGALQTLRGGSGGGGGTQPGVGRDGEGEQHGQAPTYPGGHRPSTSVNQVTVSTVHRAKGMEWPCVVVPDCWVGEFPTGRQDREERRVFYVAMSRAMTHLILVTARTSEDGRYTRRSSTSELKGDELEEEHYTALVRTHMQNTGLW